MAKQVLEIDVTTPEELIETLISSVAFSMSEWEEGLLEVEVPTREECDSDEEYKEVMVYMMTELVDEVKDRKKRLFVSNLNSYNDFLSMKNQILPAKQERAKQAEVVIGQAYKNLKRTGIISLVVTLIVPGALPIVLIIAVPLVLRDVAMKLFSDKLIRDAERLEVSVNFVQDAFYDLVNRLRDDYHQSNKELDLLRERAEKGENVIPELLEIVRPERVNLTKEQGRLIQESEEYKQKVKKEGNN